MREVRASEVLATGLKRAIDWRVVLISTLTGIVTILLSALLEHVGPNAVPGSVAHLLWAQLRTLIALAPSSIGSAAALRVVFARERGETPTFGPVFTGFHRIYLAQLFSSFALGFGLACFIIPVFVIGVVIGVLMPVVLEEGVGPLDGWTRCRALIENRADTVAVVVMVAWTIMALIVVAVLLPFGMSMGYAPFIHALNAMSDPTLDAALVVERIGWGSVWAGISGVLYLRLRERELPSDAEKIARVFD